MAVEVVTASFTLPIIGNKYASYLKRSLTELVDTKLVVQIDASGLDSNVDITFKHSNIFDITKASIMKDASNNDIVINTGDVQDMAVVGTWHGALGYVEIDELLATTGTIIFHTLVNSDE